METKAELLGQVIRKMNHSLNKLESVTGPQEFMHEEYSDLLDLLIIAVNGFYTDYTYEMAIDYANEKLTLEEFASEVQAECQRVLEYERGVLH